MKTSKLLKSFAVCAASFSIAGIAGSGTVTARAAETETTVAAAQAETTQTTETEAEAFITLSADAQTVPAQEQETAVPAVEESTVGTEDTTDAEEQENEDVEVNDGKTLKLQVGQRATISLTGAKNARWSVSDNKSNKSKKNSKIVKLGKKKSTTVRVKALKKGSCYVKAKVAGETYTCKVVVKNATGAVKGTMKKTYTQEELDLLSRLINGEAGCSWISDTEQRAVGSVVLNRIKSKRFPNTLRGVIYQRGQYACTWDGNFNKKPSKRAIANAKYLLENGSTLPSNVVFQAQFIQGRGVYTKLGNHYFCYI